MIRVLKCFLEKLVLFVKLNDGYYWLILLFNVWFDCDIIYEVYVCFRNINLDVEGLQGLIFDFVKNFNQVNREYIQILYISNVYCVCVSLVGCEDCIVNLFVL